MEAVLTNLYIEDSLTEIIDRLPQASTALDAWTVNRALHCVGTGEYDACRKHGNNAMHFLMLGLNVIVYVSPEGSQWVDRFTNIHEQWRRILRYVPDQVKIEKYQSKGATTK